MDRWRLTRKISPLEASDAPMPVLHGIYWLKRNTATDRFVSIAKWGSYLIPVIFLITLVAAYFVLGLDDVSDLSPAKQEKFEELKTMSALLIIAIAGLPVIVTFALANMRRQLGTDGHRIYVRMSDGQQASFAPEQAVYGARQIRFGNLVVAVQTGHGQPLYAEGELETYIAPLLKRAKKLGPLALIRHEFSHPDRLTIFLIVFVGMLIVLLFTTGLWEKVLFPKR